MPPKISREAFSEQENGLPRRVRLALGKSHSDISCHKDDGGNQSPFPKQRFPFVLERENGSSEMNSEAKIDIDCYGEKASSFLQHLIIIFRGVFDEDSN